jgi:hypothetical protein
LRATITDASASGTEVPAAIMSKPITKPGTPSTQPAREAKSTMTKEKMPIQKIDMLKVIMYLQKETYCVSHGK